MVVFGTPRMHVVRHGCAMVVLGTPWMHVVRRGRRVHHGKKAAILSRTNPRQSMARYFPWIRVVRRGRRVHHGKKAAILSRTNPRQSMARYFPWIRVVCRRRCARHSKKATMRSQSNPPQSMVYYDIHGHQPIHGSVSAIALQYLPDRACHPSPQAAARWWFVSGSVLFMNKRQIGN
jgi:hypothetical protein